MTTTDQRVNTLADQISALTYDEMWDLAKLLVDRHRVAARLLESDLNFAEQDLHSKDQVDYSHGRQYNTHSINCTHKHTMEFVINLRADINEVVKNPELVDVLDEFTTVSNIHPKDILTFHPDLYCGGVWHFDTTKGNFEMIQAHSVWHPDIVHTQIKSL